MTGGGRAPGRRVASAAEQRAARSRREPNVVDGSRVAAEGRDGRAFLALSPNAAAAELDVLLGGEQPRCVRLGAFIRRAAWLRALTSAAVATMTPDAPEVAADVEVARALVRVLCGVLGVVEPGAEPRSLHVEVTVARRGRWLVLAVAVGGVEARPVPTRAGTDALIALEALVAGLGGVLSRGVEEGVMLFGATLPVTSRQRRRSGRE